MNRFEQNGHQKRNSRWEKLGDQRQAILALYNCSNGPIAKTMPVGYYEAKFTISNTTNKMWYLHENPSNFLLLKFKEWKGTSNLEYTNTLMPKEPFTHFTQDKTPYLQENILFLSYHNEEWQLLLHHPLPLIQKIDEQKECNVTPTRKSHQSRDNLQPKLIRV